MNLLIGVYFTLEGPYRALFYLGAGLSFCLVIWTHFWIPESTRYLKARKLKEQALKDFRFIAKFN